MESVGAAPTTRCLQGSVASTVHDPPLLVGRTGFEPILPKYQSGVLTVLLSSYIFWLAGRDSNSNVPINLSTAYKAEGITANFGRAYESRTHLKSA